MIAVFDALVDLIVDHPWTFVVVCGIPSLVLLVALCAGCAS